MSGRVMALLAEHAQRVLRAEHLRFGEQEPPADAAAPQAFLDRHLGAAARERLVAERRPLRRDGLELDRADVERDDVEAALGEAVRRPARVGSHVEEALAGPWLEAGEHRVEGARLLLPVAKLVVGQREHALATPALVAHELGEALE